MNISHVDDDRLPYFLPLCLLFDTAQDIKQTKNSPAATAASRSILGETTGHTLYGADCVPGDGVMVGVTSRCLETMFRANWAVLVELLAMMKGADRIRKKHEKKGVKETGITSSLRHNCFNAPADN